MERPFLKTCGAVALAVAVAGCASGPAPETGAAAADRRDTVSTADVEAPAQTQAALAAAIAALGPDVDPGEAERLARLAYAHTDVLAAQYRIEDGPLIHNMKVNLGIKPRGLCKDWADDLETRFRQEGFRTLEFHRAIANADNLRIEHSTVIVSAPGDDMFAGIVLDPWRLGGELHWTPTLADDKYVWVPRAEVFAMKRAQLARDARLR